MSKREEVPDEVWYLCPDCEGTGKVNAPDVPDSFGDWDTVDIKTEDDAAEAFGTVLSKCDECDGLGRIEGDPEDMDLAETLGWVRVEP